MQLDLYRNIAQIMTFDVSSNLLSILDKASKSPSKKLKLNLNPGSGNAHNSALLALPRLLSAKNKVAEWIDNLCRVGTDPNKINCEELIGNLHVEGIESDVMDDQIRSAFQDTDEVAITEKLDGDENILAGLKMVVGEMITEVAKVGSFAAALMPVKHKVPGLPENIASIVKPIIYQALIQTFINLQNLGLESAQLEKAVAAIRYALNNGEGENAKAQIDEALHKYPDLTKGLKSA